MAIPMPSRLEFKNKSIGNEENRQSRCLPGLNSEIKASEMEKTGNPDAFRPEFRNKSIGNEENRQSRCLFGLNSEIRASEMKKHGNPDAFPA